MSEGYIIEHPTRGVLMDLDVSPVTASTKSVYCGWRARFSTVADRSAGERFWSIADLMRALSRLHPDLREEVVLMRYLDLKKVRLEDLT